MMLPTGTIVSYKPGNESRSYPAIVFQQWPEGTVELHVFHFENGTHVRAADPSQITPMVDPRQIALLVDEHEFLYRRVTELESAFQEMRPLLVKLREITGVEKSQIVLPPPSPPIPVDASTLDLDETGEEAPVSVPPVESTPEEEEPNVWNRGRAGSARRTGGK